MEYTPIPENYRKSPPLIFNVDYFDFAAGAGYKKYYLAGSDDSVGEKNFLTVDSSLVSDDNNKIFGANGTDIDFDLKFATPITIAAADATINYTMVIGADKSVTIAWTIYHVRGVAETSLGTVTDTTSGSGANTQFARCVKFTLTKKKFSPGDILRVNAIVTSNTTELNGHCAIDPSGRTTLGTLTSTAVVNVPFEIDI